MTTTEFRVHLAGITAAAQALVTVGRAVDAPPLDEVTPTALERLDEAAALLAEALGEIPDDDEDTPGLTNMAAQEFVDAAPAPGRPRRTRGPLIR